MKTTILFLTLVLPIWFAAGGCGLGKRDDATTGSRPRIFHNTIAPAPTESPAAPGDVVGESGAAVVEGAGTAAVRQFNQLRQSMSAVTGVLPTDTAVTQIFDQSKNLLSRDGNAEGVTPSMLMITTGMAGAYCGKFIDKEKALAAGARAVHGGVDFTKGPGSFADAARREVIRKYAVLFWRREPTATELTMLVTALDEALVGRQNTTTELVNALRVICTATLGSLEFIES